MIHGYVRPDNNISNELVFYFSLNLIWVDYLPNAFRIRVFFCDGDDGG